MTTELKMSKVVLYDPAVSSLNLGDHIISDSVHGQLQPLLDPAFVIDVSSHLPVSRYLSYVGNVDYKFVCGSNLLRGRMNARFRQWDLTPRYANLVGPAILVGAGWWQYGDEPNAYTRWLYRRVLSSEYQHSVRDELTASYMKRMGFRNVVNTACPTMWTLDEQHCAVIPAQKGLSVVTTVTDYSKDPRRDRFMLETLANSYHSVKIWLQGTGDLDYLESLELPWTEFDLIGPNLASYDRALSDPGVDYVGTRLHAGIRALQRGRRALVIGVDNRAAEKHRDFNLAYLARDEIYEGLLPLIRGEWSTDIRIPEERIHGWKAQFPELVSAQCDIQT